ncbi:hypothetical protein ABZ793_34015 [Micromonospora sp. NPDC047465]|uniref:hypothetical protein n=1 Tax=Micromonospora sp. NPDC047465 TaxID=3154813 RepID=UPI0033E83135
MPTTHLIRGHVPEDSPLRALTGRIVTMPARSLAELAERVRELRQAGIRPIVLAVPRRVPWTPIAWALTGGVLAALITALVAILTGHTGAAWTAAGAMVLLAVALFPTLTHLEMDR